MLWFQRLPCFSSCMSGAYQRARSAAARPAPAEERQQRHRSPSAVGSIRLPQLRQLGGAVAQQADGPVALRARSA